MSPRMGFNSFFSPRRGYKNGSPTGLDYMFRVIIVALDGRPTLQKQQTNPIL
jgi:hypothetical protein